MSCSSFIAGKRSERYYPTFRILQDPGDKVMQTFYVDGLPRTYIFNRKGKLAAEVMDGRTPAQFETLLQKAGL